MTTLFCCDSIAAYKPQYLDHQSKFSEFFAWAQAQAPQQVASHKPQPVDLTQLNPLYVVQLVRQVNYGPLESKRWFAKAIGSESFVEVTENDLVQANFAKLNSYVFSWRLSLEAPRPLSNATTNMCPAVTRTIGARCTISFLKLTYTRRTLTTDTTGVPISIVLPAISISRERNSLFLIVEAE
jgi:hypothetical protein